MADGADKRRRQTKTAPEPLTAAEAYYVEGHLSTKSPEEMAAELNLPINRVREHVTHFKSDETRASKLLARHSSGAIAMTAGASAAADEKRMGGKEISQMIQAATQRGDYEEAARLQAQLKASAKAAADKAANPRQTDHIHRLPRRPKFNEGGMQRA